MIIYIYIRTNDWTMPGGATTCLNTTIFKSNVSMPETVNAGKCQ